MYNTAKFLIKKGSTPYNYVVACVPYGALGFQASAPCYKVSAQLKKRAKALMKFEKRDLADPSACFRLTIGLHKNE